MGLSVYNIKKWYKMLTGNSIMHVNQDMGKCFVPGKLEGYFNNMTEKVTKDPETLEKKTIPMTTDEVAGVVYFPVAIFQYGLGAFDLYLMTKEEKYINQFWNCVKFAVENQKDLGAWNNFGFVYPESPYGSMCQGEGASLLLRAYKVTGENQYFERAQKAIDAAYGEAIINISLSLVLVVKCGLIGVAIGTLVATSFRMIYYAVYLTNHIFNRPISKFIKRETVNFVIVILISIAGKMLIGAWMVDNYFGWVLCSVIIALIAIAISSVINYIFYREQFSIAIKKMVRRR